MDDTIKQELTGWTDNIVSVHLPRWDELPEIDLYMDQVVVFSERVFSRFPGIFSGKLISPAIINNYVKLGIIAQPVKKKYSRSHIASLIMICILKQVLPISAITDLIAYQLETDEMAEVYNSFCAAQEAATASAVQSARARFLDEERSSRKISRDGRYDESVGLALEMAVTANSSKIIAEKIIALKRNQELAPDAEKAEE